MLFARMIIERTSSKINNRKFDANARRSMIFTSAFGDIEFRLIETLQRDSGSGIGENVSRSRVVRAWATSGWAPLPSPCPHPATWGWRRQCLPPTVAVRALRDHREGCMKRVIALLTILTAAWAHASDSVKPVSPGTKSGTSTSGNKSGGGRDSGGRTSGGGTDSGGKAHDPATRVDISGNRPERPGGYNSKGESLERPKDNAGPIRSGGGGGPALGPKPKETKDGS